MERPEKTSDNDITAEPYKGPGALITGAGEGAIAHYGTGAAGLIGGGLVGGLIPKQVNQIEKAFKDFHAWTRDSNIVMRALGTTANLMHLAAHKSVEHLPGRDHLFKRIPANRLEAVIFGGGLMGFIGFFLTPALFMFTGAKHANQGKDQFHRAQDEILTTRAERDALRNKYAESQVELETLRARTERTANNNDALSVAKDNPPTLDAPHDASMASLSAAAPTTTIAQATAAERVAHAAPQHEASLS